MLRLPWPRSVVNTASLMDVDVFQYSLPGVNPECLVGVMGDGSDTPCARP